MKCPVFSIGTNVTLPVTNVDRRFGDTTNYTHKNCA